MVYGLPGFIQEAAITALETYDATTGEMRAAYRRRRDLVTTALSETPGLRVMVPEAGMFVLLDTRATGLAASRSRLAAPARRRGIPTRRIRLRGSGVRVPSDVLHDERRRTAGGVPAHRSVLQEFAGSHRVT